MSGPHTLAFRTSLALAAWEGPPRMSLDQVCSAAAGLHQQAHGGPGPSDAPELGCGTCSTLVQGLGLA